MLSEKQWMMLEEKLNKYHQLARLEVRKEQKVLQKGDEHNGDTDPDSHSVGSGGHQSSL